MIMKWYCKINGQPYNILHNYELNTIVIYYNFSRTLSNIEFIFFNDKQEEIHKFINIIDLGLYADIDVNNNVIEIDIDKLKLLLERQSFKIKPLNPKAKTEKRMVKTCEINKTNLFTNIDDLSFVDKEEEVFVGMEEVSNAELVLKINEIISIINRKVVD